MEETMKCIKNSQNGNIIRVTDIQANNMVGNTWSYVSKSDWKTATRKSESVVVEEKTEETIAQKQLKRKKNGKDKTK